MLFNKNHPPSYTMYVFYGNVVHFFFGPVGRQRQFISCDIHFLWALSLT